jgi:hypothetical protein
VADWFNLGRSERKSWEILGQQNGPGLNHRPWVSFTLKEAWEGQGPTEHKCDLAQGHKASYN